MRAALKVGTLGGLRRRLRDGQEAEVEHVLETVQSVQSGRGITCGVAAGEVGR